MPLRVRLRYAASLPFALLQHLTLAFGVVINNVCRFLMWLSFGARDHVWLVCLRAKRWTRGERTWVVDDCVNHGIQPRTDAERELAERDPRLMCAKCTCSDPNCENKVPHYQVLPPGALLVPKARMAEIRAMSREAQQKIEDERKKEN